MSATSCSQTVGGLPARKATFSHKARFILLTPSVSDYLSPCTPAAGNSCRRRWHALTRLGSMNAPASSLIFARGGAKITQSSNDVTDLCAWLSKNMCLRVSVRACLLALMNERTNDQMNELRQVCGWTCAVCMHVYVGMCLCACIGLHRHSVGLGPHI